jgi:Polysaccharide lyase
VGRLLKAATAISLLLGLLTVLILERIPLHVRDGFESARLSWIRWSRYRFTSGAVVSEQSVVHSGRRALAITVHSGDFYEPASGDGPANERAELMESWWLFSHVGRTYAYEFSLCLPKDFPSATGRLVIAQWKELCEAFRCHPDNPVLAVRYADGRVEITRHDEGGSMTLYEGDEDIRGKWLDFRFVIRLESTNAGTIDAALNEREIVHYRGPTVYRPAHGYPSNGLVYFKMGLYRDALHQAPWTIYVDDYRKDQCDPSGCG